MTLDRIIWNAIQCFGDDRAAIRRAAFCVGNIVAGLMGEDDVGIWRQAMYRLSERLEERHDELLKQSKSL